MPDHLPSSELAPPFEAAGACCPEATEQVEEHGDGGPMEIVARTVEVIRQGAITRMIFENGHGLRIAIVLPGLGALHALEGLRKVLHLDPHG